MPKRRPQQSRTATENKWGTVKYANSVEAADTSNFGVSLSPARLNGAIDTFVPDASETVEGKVELATDVEAQTKTESGNKALIPSNLAADGFLQWVDVTLTSPEIKALAATPQTLVAAPGADKVIKFIGAMLKLNYGGSNAFTETDDNLLIKYTDGSGIAVTGDIEMTGFIDQTADTYTNAEPVIDAIVAATGAENQALVLDNPDDEIAGNVADDNTLTIRVFYQVMSI